MMYACTACCVVLHSNTGIPLRLPLLLPLLLPLILPLLLPLLFPPFSLSSGTKAALREILRNSPPLSESVAGGDGESHIKFLKQELKQKLTKQRDNEEFLEAIVTQVRC